MKASPRITRRSTVLLVSVVLLAAGSPPAGRAWLWDASDLRDTAQLCAQVSVIRLPDGRALCTHGPDPAPAGVDYRVEQPLVAPGSAQGLLFPDSPGDTPSKAAATPGIACHGDGTSGPRVHALYGVPADRKDRYDAVVGSIRHWAAEMNAVFQTSASRTGGTRHIRFVTDSQCNLVVDHVKLSARSDDTFQNTLNELALQGYNKSDRKYVLWMDATQLCGIGTYYADDRAIPDNFNNGRTGTPASVSRIDAGCWGLGSRGQSVEAHELMHNLGAVLPTAPSATVNGHCDDDSDRMCYEDGSPLLSLRSVCGADNEALFDCSNDDYFSTAPAPGNYLATHWNTANSAFLAGASSVSFVSIADLTVSEGRSGQATISVPVTLSAPSAQPLSVRFATADNSARSPDDYLATTGTLTFAPGETSKGIAVAIQGDRLQEVDESFTVTLSSPSNAILDSSQAFVTISDGEPTSQGYWFVAADGGIFSFGNAGFFGSTGAITLNQPIVGMASTPSGKGYWLVARDGGIFSFGDAGFYGSTGAITLNQPIVGMATTPSGKGYWFVAADGGIFAFGDAGFHGSGSPSGQRIVGMAATPSGKGYWFVGSGGAVAAFGDARTLGGSTASEALAGIEGTPTGFGYWLVGSNGPVDSFGDARAFGSPTSLHQPLVGMASTPKGGGYWLVARDGGIFSYGDAKFLGSTGSIHLNQPIVGMTATRAQ
jgi:hypothetical protein